MRDCFRGIHSYTSANANRRARWTVKVRSQLSHKRINLICLGLLLSWDAYPDVGFGAGNQPLDLG